MSARVNVWEVVDGARLRAIHFIVLAVCFATAVVDGLDNQMIGFSAAAIAADLGLPLSAFGLIFSAGTFGILFGSMSLGALADAIGRRRALMVCTLVFTVFTLATPFARTVPELLVLRVLAGLGLGGAMPGFLTLASEYAPKKHRALATGILWSGYPTGGVIGGLVGSVVLPAFGWRAMFWVGAGLGLAIVAAQWLLLPESLQFLALRRPNEPGRIRRIMKRLAPEFDRPDLEFVVEAKAAAPRVSFTEVFARERRLATLLLWAPLFFTFMITNFFVLWAPALFKTNGMSVSAAALMVALNNFAAVPSQALSGQVIGRTNPFRLLLGNYLLFAIVIAVLALSLGATPIVAAAMLCIGLLQGPSVVGLLYVATSLYPSRMRSTGVGWAMGVGRSGQVVGSLVIGAIVAGGATPKTIILCLCFPPLAALVAVLGLERAARGLAAEQPA